MKLSDKIGDSIAKMPMGDDMEGPDDDEEESDESPGAKLAEALGLEGVDSAKVDEALRAAIRQLK
jgi:hypothetical protein